MANIIEICIEYIKELVQSSNIFLSLFIGVFIVILESIIPMLPLAVFIAINTIAFGNLIGFIISWIGTIIGCTLSFYIFRFFRKKFLLKFQNNIKIHNLMKKINNISFSNLVIILAFPFTPAFSINIGAGLSNIPYKKYFFALLISKLSIIYFWGFIGTTFLESITDIGVLIKLVIIIFVAFVLSKIVMKKFDIR